MNHEGEHSHPIVRVLVVDDQQLMRDGIASLLALQESIEVAGTAANGEQALEQALWLQPDVILMDVRMPIMDGVEATAQIRSRLPLCQILMLTTFDDDEYVVEALRAGAVGYLLKDIPAHDLAQAVQAAHKGIYQLDPIVARKIVTSLVEQNIQRSLPPVPPAPPEKSVAPRSIKHGDLTEREREVLRLIARGATNREIAEILVISEGTVKNHISHILNRLGVRDRTQAALFAHEIGIL